MDKSQRLKKKIVEILADYKFNSSQLNTTERVAERIINIVKEATR